MAQDSDEAPTQPPVSVDPAAPLDRLVLRSGAEAQLVRTAAEEVLTVRDAHGNVLFELRGSQRTVVLDVGEGDLELRARGRLRLVGGEVEIEGATVSVTAERLRQAVGVLETRANRILERAKDTYRDVDGLSQLRAGHVRTVARQTFRVLADRLRMKAKKDAAIDGEKIFLG